MIHVFERETSFADAANLEFLHSRPLRFKVAMPLPVEKGS